MFRTARPCPESRIARPLPPVRLLILLMIALRPRRDIPPQRAKIIN